MATTDPQLDVYACLLLDARWLDADERPTSADWVAGPLPMPLPDASGRLAGSAVVTDRAAREEYFSPRLHDVLYGSEPGGPTGRWHRQAEAVPGPDGALAEATELLIARDCTVAVVHVRLVGDPIAAMRSLTAAAGPGRDWVADVVGPRIGLALRRARAISHLVWEGAPPGAPPQLPPDIVRAAGADRALDWWAWFLAAGVSPADFVPDPQGPDWSQTRLALSRSWSVVALRDGACYVARTPRTASRDDFHALARVYVRSLHLDVFLLLLVQRSALHRVSDSVAALDLDAMSATGLQELEEDLLRVRTRLWSGDASRQGRQTSEVLIALQRQHLLPQLYERVVQDLTDVARYWAARTTAAQEAAQQLVEQRARRFSKAVSVVSFFFLPLTVVYTGAAVVADPSWELFLWSTVIGLPPCAVALVYSLRRG